MATSNSVNLGILSSSSLTNNINFLQPSNFKVIIDRKKYGNLQFFAQRVVHPGMSISNVTLPYKRISTISIAGDTANFEDLSFDVLIDEEMNSYTEVYNWMLRQLSENPQRNYTNRAARQEEPIEVDITLIITSSHNNAVRKIKYYDCIPTSIGTMLMEATVSDTQIITYPLTFKVGYFEVE
jgi:hypothetical protein